MTLRSESKTELSTHLAVEPPTTTLNPRADELLDDLTNRHGVTAAPALQGTVDVFTRTPTEHAVPTVGGDKSLQACHPAERFCLHGEFHTVDGREYATATLSVDGSTDAASRNLAETAFWLAGQATVNGHDEPEQLYQFADEDSLTGALQFLHDTALRRLDIRVIADCCQLEPEVFRRVVIYEMNDSVWMLEHIRPSASGRYLRLRSTGLSCLSTYLEELITPHDSAAGERSGDSGRCSSSTTDV